MILFKQASQLFLYLEKKRAEGAHIGFVPTMGALHAGHISLIDQAKASCDLVVCSIFVNPTQFNNPNDLATYPRTPERDIQLLEEAGCHVLFHPEASDVYEPNEQKLSSADYGYFITVLEGAKRPGHFDGVVTILTKLFAWVEPNEVYFGQKDYQQCLVVKELIKRKFPEIKFHMCAILREKDGLAMSSRNVRLTAYERKLAPAIYETMLEVGSHWNANEWQEALATAQTKLSKEPFNLEYLTICNAETLEPLSTFEEKAILLVAVVLGNTRLIDNLMLP